MNKYRVDRANSLIVPSGTNSICYIGDSWDEARKVYNYLDTRKDAWNRPNPAYGVILSVWNENKNDYIVKCSKGLY